MVHDTENEEGTQGLYSKSDANARNHTRIKKQVSYDPALGSEPPAFLLYYNVLTLVKLFIFTVGIITIWTVN